MKSFKLYDTCCYGSPGLDATEDEISMLSKRYDLQPGLRANWGPWVPQYFATCAVGGGVY